LQHATCNNICVKQIANTYAEIKGNYDNMVRAILTLTNMQHKA